MTPEERLMKTAVEAWGHGDNGPIYAALHEDVVWISAANRWDERLRSGGIHKGRGETVALLSKLATAYYNASCVTKEVISRGNVVWGLFQITSTYAPSGPQDVFRKPVNWEMALRWRIKDGKVMDAQTFFDTADLLRQQGHTSLNGGAQIS